MSYPVKFTDGQSVQALDPNSEMIAYAGHGVVSGCSVSINTGALGSTEATVTVDSGTLLVGGVSSDETSADVSLEEADPNHPRKDLIVYDPSIPGFTAITGAAEEANPVGAIRQNAERPAPPSLASSVDAISGSGDPLIPLSEAWVPAGASGITSDDLADRRMEVSPEVYSVSIDGKVDIPKFSDDTNAPNETLFYNTDKSRTKYKDSSGVVHEPSRTVVYMSDYVAAADRDGSVAVDTEFDAAIADCDPGDTLVFDDGTYQLSTQHTITKELTIDSANAIISCTNTSNNDPHIFFRGSGTGNSTTTTEVGTVGQRTIGVNDTTIFSAGDRVLFIEDSYVSNVNSQIQYAEVESVDGTNGNITTMNALSKEFISGTNVYVVDLLDSPKMKNLNTQGGGNRHLQFRWCEEPTFDNVSISEYLEVSLYTADCWKPRYRDVEATDPMGLASGEGEPIALYRCTDGYVESPRVYDCRRGVDFAWGTRNITVSDPVLHGCVIGGITVHQSDEAGQFTIEGGEIVCQTNVPLSAHNGHGISMSPTAETTITGTKIVGRVNGINASGPTHASDCNIQVSDGTTEGNAAIRVAASDCSFTDCVIEDESGQFDNGVWVDSSAGAIENVHIDVNMDFGSHNMVYIDGRSADVKNVRVRGNYDLTSSSSSQGFLIHADDSNRVENIDVSVNLENHPEQGVRLLADNTNSAGVLDNIVLHDCYFSTSTAAIYSDGAGTFETIRVERCSGDTGSTSLSFNETINKLYLIANDVNGSVDSSGATNLYRVTTDTHTPSVVDTGTVTLSSGAGTISTGVEGPVNVHLDPSNGGSNGSDIDVTYSVLYDSSVPENVIEIAEQDTAVGNPTIAYTVTQG